MQKSISLFDPRNAVHAVSPSYVRVLLILRLPLDFELEIKIRRVEVVDTSITILTTGAVHCSERVDSNIVEGTEMTSDTTNLLLEHFVVETSFELSLTSRGGGDIHGCLTTAEDDVVFDGGDGGAVERGVCDVGLEDLEVVGGDELLWGEECEFHEVVLECEDVAGRRDIEVVDDRAEGDEEELGEEKGDDRERR